MLAYFLRIFFDREEKVIWHSVRNNGIAYAYIKREASIACNTLTESRSSRPATHDRRLARAHLAHFSAGQKNSPVV